MKCEGRKKKIKTCFKTAAACLLVLVLAVSLLPRIEIHAVHTFSSGAVVIDSDTVAQYGTEYVIENGVYSVTVTDGVDVTLIFDGVVIDRSSDGFGDSTTGSVTAAELYEAGRRLHDLASDAAWTNTPAGGGYYVPTCPFLVTGGAAVTARFDGSCSFRAGGNGLYLSSADGALRKAISDGSRGGYAGIQVDSGASLTIVGASGLSAYGAFPLAGARDHDGNFYDSNPLNVNPIYNHENPWARPIEVNTNGTNGGGAGIGGGAGYDTQTIAVSGHGYTAGTPGEIVIESGDIYAAGGHLAAGIGGGVNGAATSSRIVISGGNITAVGGRFATGIGDGDSTVDYESERYWHSYEIVINGGELDAYGGTSSAAVGTTDEITTRTGNYSGLSITISGGTVYAHSGEAENESSATAAIGSGQGTDIQDNSIVVYSSSKIVAASFSQFALSNYGTNADATPMVNIDPSGFMYLARFQKMEEERIFTMYPVKRDAAGNPMLVSAAASQILDGTAPAQATYYALDRERSDYYLVNAQGVAVGADGSPLSDGARYYPPELPSISYYYDTSSPIGTLVVPGNYTAFAATLSDPALYGGIYVIHIPDGGGGTADDTYAVIQKLEPGTTSGEIVNQGGYHLPAGENSSMRETPSVIEDAAANPFTGLGVFAVDPETGEAEAENRIGQFSPSTYGYTVYLPYGTETFHLYSAYSVTDTQSTVTMDTGSSSSVVTLSYGQQGQEMRNTVEISMNGSDIVNVWLRKTEPGPDGRELYVVYRITVVVKPQYTMELGALDKLYDGIPVVPAVEKLILPAGYDYVVSDGADSMPAGGYDVSSPDIPESGTEILRYERDFVYNHIIWDNSQTLTVSVSMEARENGYDVIIRIERDSLWTDEATVVASVHLDAEDPAQRLSLTSADSSVGNFTVVIDGATVRLRSSNGNYTYDILSFSLSDILTESSMSADEVEAAKTAAIEAAKREAQSLVGEENAGEQVSVNKQYEKGIQTYTGTLSVSDLQNGGTETYRLSLTGRNSLMGNVRVYTTYNVQADMTDEMTALDRNAVVYTYYRILAVDETGRPTSIERLDAAPKDAGMYFVTASLAADAYEGYGSIRFQIYRREIEIIAVENWLSYKMPAELVEYGEGLSGWDGAIEDPGALSFLGVLSGETVTLAPGYTVRYEDRGTLGTYADDIGYHERKIIISGVWLNPDDPVNRNYILSREAVQSDGSATFRVYGQIAYETTGAIFRKTLSADSFWRKFYPTTDPTFLKWQTDENGDYIRDDAGNLIPEPDETRIDYHSPSNTEHRDYVYLRTVNAGENEVRYAVDVEFGAMQFTYSRAVWDVNRYDYVEGESSVWTGNDGVNNRISVVNYSNGDIRFRVDAAIEFEYRPITEGSPNGISLYLADKDGVPQELNTPVTVPAAVAAQGDAPGRASQESMQLVLTGVPQMTSEDFVTVGIVSVLISKAE